MMYDRMLRQTRRLLAESDETLRQSAAICESSLERVWASREILPNLKSLTQDNEKNSAAHD